MIFLFGFSLSMVLYPIMSLKTGPETGFYFYFNKFETVVTAACFKTASNSS